MQFIHLFLNKQYICVYIFNNLNFADDQWQYADSLAVLDENSRFYKEKWSSLVA